MKVLIVGATGATGRLLVEQLLNLDQEVKVIVRSSDRLPESIRKHQELEIIEASLLDLSDEELSKHVKGCDAVASCLGHNVSWKGLFGKPRRLVTDATRRLCQAIIAIAPKKPVKYVLMNTIANRNRDLNEHISLAERLIIALLRLLLPPHPDNEQAAEFLRTQIGQGNPVIQWVAVRPDSLIDEEQVSDYELHPSPTGSAIFNSSKTSRINVAHFMAELIVQEKLWKEWQGQMPVIYNTQRELDE